MLSNKRTLLNKDRLVDVKDDELPIAEALYAHRGGRSSVDDVCDKEWEKILAESDSEEEWDEKCEDSEWRKLLDKMKSAALTGNRICAP